MADKFYPVADAIEITEYPPVASRAVDLGLAAPTTIAVLPRNFASAASRDDLLAESTAATIHQLLDQADVAHERFDSATDPFRSVAEHSVDWIAPIIFVGAAYASENPDLISVALGVIANYVHELFGDLPGDRRVRLDVVVERDADRISKRISYEGTPEGVSELIPAVEEAVRSDD